MITLGLRNVVHVLLPLIYLCGPTVDIVTKAGDGHFFIL